MSGIRAVDDARDGGTGADLVRTILARYAGANSAERVALLHDGRSVTYRQLRAAVGVAEEVLRERAGRGGHVALLLGNSPEYVVWTLAGLVAGTPLTPLHPKASAADLGFIVADSQSRLIVHSDELTAVASELTGEAELLRADVCWQAGSDAPPQDVEESIRPGDIAFLTYTGGTTGRPKGVVQTHEMLRQVVLMELAEWPWPRATRPPRFLAATPLSHGAGFFMVPTLFLGGAVVTTDRTGPVGLAEAAREAQASVTFLVPALMRSILERVPEPKAAFDTLELTVYGASPIAPADLTRCVDVFGPNLVQLYGQTESPMILATLRPEDHDPGNSVRLAACGLPSAGATVVVLDDDDLPVPAGTVGEICARGPLVMPGYWNRPEESAAALRSGWLHTGDLGVFDEDGYLAVVGRKKDMIITGGFNVYPKEVEDALVEHDLVMAAAVFGVPDATWGERVVAAIVTAEPLDPEEVKAFVRALKGPIQTPKDVVTVAEIPLTAVGKPDKAALRAMAGSLVSGGASA